MSKTKDIDIAFVETLRKHPDYSDYISSLLYDNATRPVNTRNFTNNNMARTRVKTSDSNDFIEYIVRNAIIIYFARNELITNGQRVPNDSFPNFAAIEEAMPIVSNPRINSILYYKSNPNALFALAEAVGHTRFNSKYYKINGTYDSRNSYLGDEFRNQIDSLGAEKSKEILAKIDHDVQIVKPVRKMNVNYDSVNQCLREIATGAQVKYNRNEYALDGTLYATQDVGRKRQNQEDSVLIMTHPENSEFKFLAVADGMGGLSAGEEASNYVVSEISKWFKTIPADAYYFTDGLMSSFAHELERISADLYAKYQGKAGSTFTGAIVTRDNTFVVSVGDSRAYSMSGNNLSLLTQDESVVWREMAGRVGQDHITEQELDNLRFNTRNNVITKCIGQERLYVTQRITVPNFSYDTLLLFSDGVTDLLSQSDIRIIAQNTPRQELTKALVDRAINADAVGLGARVPAGKDNASVAMFGR